MIAAAPASLLVPILAAQAPAPKPAPLLQALADHRGGLVVVGAPGAWMQRLGAPNLQVLLEGLLVETRPVTDPACLQLGIARPGVYLLTPAGKLRASWQGDAPSDLEAALRSAGLTSSLDELKSFLAAHPERVDVHWRLIGKLESQVGRTPTPQAYQAYADAMDAVLRQGRWMEGRYPFRGTSVKVPKGAKVDPLAPVAQAHWHAVLDVVRRAPTLEVAWDVVERLAEWHPDHPRLSEVILDLPVPPLEGFALSVPETWPTFSAVQAARDQLVQLKDWPRLELYALDRLGRIRGAGELYHPDLSGSWSGVTRYFSDSDTPVKPTRREAEGERLGPWLLALLTAQLGQGKALEAQETLLRIQREADEGSRKEAERLIREAAQPPKKPQSPP